MRNLKIYQEEEFPKIKEERDKLASVNYEKIFMEKIEAEV